MRKVLNGRILLLVSLLLWVCLVRMLTGCNVNKENQDKVRDLEFIVVGEADVPGELQEIIVEKKQQRFKLTYSDDKGFYKEMG